VGRPSFFRVLVVVMLVGDVALAQGPAPIAAPLKWSPPVVELLVDPWAKGQVAAPVARPARPQWEPARVDRIDIVDPWAADAPQVSPRVASHLAGPPHSTIF